MKIPKSLRINGMEYTIAQVQNLNDGCSVLQGEINFKNGTIALNSEYCHEEKCITLLHEALHGYERAAELELGENREHIIEVFARGMYQLLQDNGCRLFDMMQPTEMTGGPEHAKEV